MKEKLLALVQKVKDHKVQIIKVGMILAGAAIGMAVANVFEIPNNTEEVGVEYDESVELEDETEEEPEEEPEEETEE